MALAARGTDVVATYRADQAAADTPVAEVAALGRTAVALPLVTADTASFDALADALTAALRETWGRDALVHNAGAGLFVSVADATEAGFDDMMNVHVKGVFFLTQRPLPTWERWPRKGG